MIVSYKAKVANFVQDRSRVSISCNIRRDKAGMRIVLLLMVLEWNDITIKVKNVWCGLWMCSVTSIRLVSRICRR